MGWSCGRLGDEDYDDMMYVVGRQSFNSEPSGGSASIPEPAMFVLFGSSLGGLMAIEFRRRVRR